MKRLRTMLPKNKEDRSQHKVLLVTSLLANCLFIFYFVSTFAASWYFEKTGESLDLQPLIDEVNATPPETNHGSEE